MPGYVTITLAVLALSTQVDCQFFDFFQGLQPFLEGQPTLRPVYIEHNTRKTKIHANNRRNNNRQSNKQQINKTYDDSRYISLPYNEQINSNVQIKEKPVKKKSTTVSNYNFHSTTITPNKKLISSSSNNNSNSRNNTRDQSNSNFKKHESDNVNNNANYYSTSPNYNNPVNNNNWNGNNKVNVNNNYNYNTHTTQNSPVNNNDWNGNNKVNANNNYNYNTHTTQKSVNSNDWNGNDKVNANNNYNYNTHTTQKPVNNNDWNGNDKVNANNNYNYNTHTTQKPVNNNEWNGNNKVNANNNYNYNTYTTENSLLNKPGVRPAVVDNRPPITNRPVTQRPRFGDDPDNAASPLDWDASPELLTGMNEDSLSEVEKARYIEVAERMCDKYKELNMKQLQAIPLVPSPEPVNINVSACAPTTVPLVVGGKVVSIKEFPHMALLGWLKRTGGYSWKCGGSLVSDQFVLTAAHCAYQERDNNVITGTPRAVQLGSSYLNDPHALVVKISVVLRHPKYKLPRSYYDLALVKLVNKLQFSDVVKPACLGEPPREGGHIIATGWGRTEFGGDQSNELRSVSLPVWNIQDCHEVLGTSRKLPNGPSGESQMCAGERNGGKDTCQGDSGGPAQVQDGCVWRVVAVTSLGRSCGAPHTPGLYAIAQRAWISAHVFSNQKLTNYKPNNSQQQSNDNYSRSGNDYQQSNPRNNNDNYNRNSDTSNQNNYNNNYNGFSNNNNGQENYGISNGFNNNRQSERSEVSNTYNRNRYYETDYNNNGDSYNNQRYNVVGVW